MQIALRNLRNGSDVMHFPLCVLRYGNPVAKLCVSQNGKSFQKMEMGARAGQSPSPFHPPQKSSSPYNHFFSLIFNHLHHFDKKTSENIWNLN